MAAWRKKHDTGRNDTPNQTGGSEGKRSAKEHWDGLGKPLGSLGRLEDVIIQIAGIQRTPQIHIENKALVIMCADNGVVEEGVTQCGQVSDCFRGREFSG